MIPQFRTETAAEPMYDDGVRFIKTGVITVGNSTYDYVYHENARLVADTIAIKNERKMIKQRNWEKFS